MDVSTLEFTWFWLIAVLWVGYFVLEGFDFGVGMLLRALGRTTAERRAIMHSIGPVWDGNEVWVIVAGGATFAAFPEWYATLFSGFYVALFLILAALIVRGVAFEFWGKEDGARWRASWEWCLVIGSFLPALLWGVAWANIVGGVPLDADAEFRGDLLDLLGPYALLGGLTTLLLFLAHGAMFLALRITTGELQQRARGVVRWAAPAAAVTLAAFLIWTLGRQADREGIEPLSLVCAVGAAGLAVAVAAVGARRPGLGFGCSCGTIALLFVALAVDLYPDVMVSSGAPGTSLAIPEAPPRTTRWG